MSCARTAEAFGDTLSTEYAAHLKTCAECTQARRAYEAVGAVDVAPATDAQLEAARLAAQAELAAHPRVRPWWFGAIALLAVDAALAIALPVAVSLRNDTFAWLLGLSWWAVAATGAIAALVPGRPSLRWATVAAGGVVLLATLAGTSELGEPVGVACAKFELAVSLLPVAVVLGLLMRFAFDPLRAAVAGMAAAAVGVGVLCVHCPSTAFAHVLAFHVLPWVALTVLAAVARRALPSHSLAP